MPTPNPETSEDAEALKRKLAEMEAKVSVLETELSSLRRPARPRAWLKTWVSRFVLAVVFILAVIPAALVVGDMWFRQVPAEFGAEMWCSVPFLCSSKLPAYFSLILGCFLILAVIMFVLRNETIVVQENPLRLFENSQVGPLQMKIGFRLLVLSGLGMVGVIIWSVISQHWPGWDLVIVWLLFIAGWALRAVPFRTAVDSWKRNGEFWVSLLLMHIAIVAALAAYYEATEVFYFSLLLPVFAFANLWRFRQHVPAIFWVVSITLIFYSVNINGWWTAIVGDDYGFHELAWAFAEKMSFEQIGSFLFQGDGVFGRHPYFSSFLMGISMKLFGHGSFGWRFGNLYLCAIGVGLFYFFCKSFLSKQIALVAACLLAFSHYVMSFGKIGYNNLQALFVLSLVLAIAAWAVRWKQPFVFALLGSAIAMCFYLYPASLYAAPAPILLLLLYDPPKSRQALGRWLVMAVVMAALIYPLLMQPFYWETKREGTLFHRPELVQTVDMVVRHFAYNVFYSILSFLYGTEGHYVVASFVDPITGVFIILGYFVLLYQVRRQRFAIFTALMFVFFLFSVGASHDREVPSTSRMFMMVPWFALFGAWGMVWFDENLKKVGIPLKNLLVPLLLVAIAGANLYQAYKLSPMRYAATQSTATLFIAVTENIIKAQPDKQKNIAVLLQDDWGFEAMLYFKDVYPHLTWFHLDPIFITEPVLPEDKMSLFANPQTIVLVAPYLAPEWQNALDGPLTSLGKARCSIWIPDMRQFMVLYFSPDLPPTVCLFDTGLAIDEKIATSGP